MTLSLKRIGAIVAIVSLATIGVATTATPAAASHPGCWGTGPVVDDPWNPPWNTKYCHNYRSGYVYTRATTGDVSGYLYAGTNWFVCQRRGGENPPVGNARNNYWLYTQGDDGYRYGGWGWFPATMVSGGGNYQPIPNLPSCPS
jgi:hypothetical protein